ncbi:tetratricopeptide repeat protein [Mycolicibacterium goodii]|uniref:tetratricopeptide repeat protein n=1 Tax=Mycolicibacterium goodii TaxID=134601 RepID=UPI001BDCA275|nr:tetratricopeptide repeat protein [Mycolicibacterium goodii]MBU8809524.1 tetratricopeptide repeat protein [Mycolicibacterium goodii]
MMLRHAPKQFLRQLRAFPRVARDHTVAWFNPPHRRLRLRRRLALYTAPVAVLLALVAAGLIIIVVVGNSVADSFDRHDIEALRRDVEKLEAFGLIEPGNIAFARGDLLVLEGKLGEAEARFREALDRFDVETSCPVRINLELVQETLADLSVRSGRAEEAEQRYNDALTVVREAPSGCFSDNTDPNEDRRAVRADAQPRLERKLAALHAPPPPPPSGPAVVTSEPPPPPPSSSPSEGPPAPGQGEGPGQGAGPVPGQAPAAGQGPDQGSVEGQAPPAPGNAPALPPLGQGDGQSTPQTPPLPPLPGENLPAPPPPAPRPGTEQPPSGGPADGPLTVADPATPNPVQILGPVGPDGLPLGDQNTSAPDLHLNDRRRALSPADKLQNILEDANSYGGERE